MSTIMQYIRIRGAELDILRTLLIEDPNGAFDYADELADSDGDDVPAERSRSLDTDKAWAGLGFLLHAAGPLPVCPMCGGDELTSDEWGYAPPRYLSPEQVARAAAHLASTPFDALTPGFDPRRMADIEPPIWHNADALDYLRRWYGPLTVFFRHAATEQDGMILFRS